MKALLLPLLAAAPLAADHLCPQPPPCAFLPANRPCVKDICALDQSDAYIQLSFLYWLATERGLDYCIKNTQSQFNANMQFYKPTFEWQPAFRLVLGTYLPQDNWSLDITYSFYLQHLYGAAKDNFTGEFGGGLLSVWTAPGAFTSSSNLYARWQRAGIEWQLHANFFDLMLRNNLCNGRALSFQPACGLKMAILQQRYEVRYQFGNTVNTDGDAETLISSSINLKNRSFNLGPAAALATHWSLNGHWSFNGAIGGAILASQFTVGRNEFDVSSTASTQIGTYRFNNNYWTWRPQASLLFGAEWSDCVCSPRKVIHYGLKASYEMQVWWKQNMMLRHIDAPIVQSHTLAPVQGDLTFQGLTVDLFFDF